MKISYLIKEPKETGNPYSLIHNFFPIYIESAAAHQKLNHVYQREGKNLHDMLIQQIHIFPLLS